MTAEQQRTAFDRIVLFSDAVFAIAITLLVLDIDLPSHSEHDLTDALLDRWPQYTSFALSFLVIGIFWVAHHRMFRYIVRFDSRSLMAPAAFLARSQSRSRTSAPRRPSGSFPSR